MQLKDRVTVISEENYDGLLSLYGTIDFDDLQGIVNRHIAVAVEEIKEDIELNKEYHIANCANV